MTSFEEEFPSLKNTAFVVEGGFPPFAIEKYCLDKERVKKAIDEELEDLDFRLGGCLEISGDTFSESMKQLKTNLYAELGL